MSYCSPPHPGQTFQLGDFCQKAVEVSNRDVDFLCPVCGAMIFRARQTYMMTRHGTDSIKRSELAKHIQLHHWKSTCLDQYYYAMVLGDM